MEPSRGKAIFRDRCEEGPARERLCHFSSWVKRVSLMLGRGAVRGEYVQKKKRAEA